jgi:iron complex outermembrane recepter protein
VREKKMTRRARSPWITLALLPAALATSAQADQPAAPSPAPSSPSRVTITGTRQSESDYRVPTLDSIGPVGGTPLLDTPYAVSILPGDLIQNSQASDFRDVAKYLPLVAYQEQQGPDILRPQTRGMQGGNFQNTKLDGMTMFITVAQAMEQFQQIEVVNGLSAALYGPANPSGMFNFISKRPTLDPLHEVTASYTSDSIGTVKADFGGPIDPRGIFSYRLNALYGRGDGYVDGSTQRRTLGDLGIDVRPWKSGVLQLNYSDYSLTDKGYPGWFTYGESIHLPPPPDPQRVGYGQPYAGVDLRTRMMSARLEQDFGRASASNWHLVAGVLNQDAARNINTPVNNITSNSGAYTSSFANGFAPRFVITSDTAYLNGNFSTWAIGHDLTIGTAGYRASSYSVATPAMAASVRLGTANIFAPAVFPEPPGGPPFVLANYDSSDNYQQGFNLGDTLKLGERWSARIGASQDWFHTNNFNAKGIRTSEYANHGVSPSGSLLFKPAANMTTYFTYASSLQAGDIAPGTVANAGVSLPPYRSKEYELGYKASLARIDFSAALFRVERPFANIDPADQVFKISGQQVNKGAELSAVGELVPGLTLYGGLTWLDARLEHTPLAATNDKTYVGAGKFKGNLLFEYRIPGIVGLVATFDYQFNSPRAANDTNTLTAPGYNLLDVGTRYTSSLMGLQTTWRLAVDNITDRHYWSTIAPSNLTGTNTGNLLAHLGAPRTVLASMTVDF